MKGQFNTLTILNQLFHILFIFLRSFYISHISSSHVYILNLCSFKLWFVFQLPVLMIQRIDFLILILVNLNTLYLIIFRKWPPKVWIINIICMVLIQNSIEYLNIHCSHLAHIHLIKDIYISISYIGKISNFHRTLKYTYLYMNVIRYI